MGKIIVPVTEDLLALNPGANLETVLGETIQVDAPGFGVIPENDDTATTNADGPGPKPTKPPGTV